MILEFTIVQTKLNPQPRAALPNVHGLLNAVSCPYFEVAVGANLLDCESGIRLYFVLDRPRAASAGRPGKACNLCVTSTVFFRQSFPQL
jgi:hypothetical protein